MAQRHQGGASGHRPLRGTAAQLRARASSAWKRLRKIFGRLASSRDKPRQVSKNGNASIFQRPKRQLDALTHRHIRRLNLACELIRDDSLTADPTSIHRRANQLHIRKVSAVALAIPRQQFAMLLQRLGTDKKVGQHIAFSASPAAVHGIGLRRNVQGVSVHLQPPEFELCHDAVELEAALKSLRELGIDDGTNAKFAGRAV